MGPILTIGDAYLRPDPIDTFTIMRTTSVCGTVPPDEDPEVVEPPPDPPPDATVDTAVDTAPDLPADPLADVPPDSPADTAVDTATEPPADAPADDAPPDSSAGCGCTVAS